MDAGTLGCVHASTAVRVGSPALGGDRPIRTTKSTRGFRAKRSLGVSDANAGVGGSLCTPWRQHQLLRWPKSCSR